MVFLVVVVLTMSTVLHPVVVDVLDYVARKIESSVMLQLKLNSVLSTMPCINFNPGVKMLLCKVPAVNKSL